MTEAEKYFHQLAENAHDATKGKMFGALSIKASNGKTAVFFWEEKMAFKLDEKSRREALKLGGASITTHLYAPDKQMKAWVSIPAEHREKWEEYTALALKYIASEIL